jgi:rod shape-determining protein MreD
MRPTKIDEGCMEIVERAGFVMGWRILSALVPILTGFAAVLVSNLPLSLTNGLVPAPLLGLVPVYFWSLVRPDLMTPAGVFLIGLLEDIVAGGPPGIWTLSFVATYGLIDRQRDSFAGLAGLGAVLGFATAALVTCVVAYLTTAALYRPAPLGAIVAELAMTVLFFVPGVYLIAFIHRRLVGPLRSDL